MVYRQAEALVTSTEPQPSLLWIHGGPSSVDRWGFNGRAQYFANLGFVVVTVNYRGSSGFGLAHHDAVLGAGVGKADLEDCVAAAAHIRTHAAEMGVDLSRRIGVGGHSWGGYLTLMCMCSPDAEGVFSCGVAGAGIADWITQLRETELRGYDRQILGGWVHEGDLRERAVERSPITHAERLAAPMLVLHGADDLNVPYSQIVDFVDAAKSATDPHARVEFVSYVRPAPTRQRAYQPAPFGLGC